MMGTIVTSEGGLSNFREAAAWSTITTQTSRAFTRDEYRTIMKSLSVTEAGEKVENLPCVSENGECAALPDDSSGSDD